jgi:hypothetical protein
VGGNVKKYLFLIFVFLVFIALTHLTLAEEKICSIWLRIFRNDTVILESFSVEEGLQSHFPTSQTGYYVEVLSYNNEILFKANVGISFNIHILTTEIPTNITTELNEILINLRLPFFENAKEINLYHEDKKIFSLQLSNYICNKNGICEKERGETVELCPLDCHCGNGICEKILEENYENCPQDCKPEQPTFSFYIYAFIITIIFVLIFLIFWKSRSVRYESPT